MLVRAQAQHQCPLPNPNILIYSKLILPRKFLPLRSLYLSDVHLLPAPLPAVRTTRPVWDGGGRVPHPPNALPAPGGLSTPEGPRPPAVPLGERRARLDPGPTRRRAAPPNRPTADTPAAERGGARLRRHASRRREPAPRGGSPQRSQRSRKLEAVPSARRPVPGKEPAREGSAGRGCEAGEPRREFRGGPTPPAAPLLSWRRRLRRRGAGGRCPVAFRPSPQPYRRTPPASRASSASAPASERGKGEAPSPHRGEGGGGWRGVTCEEKEPARHLPPGCETLPPGEPPAGAAGGGGAAAAASPPGNILAAHWLPRRPTPPSPRPPWGSPARPLAAAAAVTRGRPGRGSGARRSLAAAARRVRVGSSSSANSAPLCLAQRREPGGFPRGRLAGAVRRLHRVLTALPARPPARSALPLPLCGDCCPAHLAGRAGGSSGLAVPSRAAAAVSVTVTGG